jgi:hypothetical protein
MCKQIIRIKISLKGQYSRRVFPDGRGTRQGDSPREGMKKAWTRAVRARVRACVFQVNGWSYFFTSMAM